MTKIEKFEFARRIQLAIRNVRKGGGSDGMERLLNAHKAAHRAGWGADALLLVQGQQWRLDSIAAGKENFMD